MIHFFALPLPEPPVAYRETDHTREKKAHTRQRLLSAARDIVAAEGFAAATAAAVAARSGVAAGTIYRHFPSKPELVAEVFRYATFYCCRRCALPWGWPPACRPGRVWTG